MNKLELHIAWADLWNTMLSVKKKKNASSEKLLKRHHLDKALKSGDNERLKYMVKYIFLFYQKD